MSDLFGSPDPPASSQTVVQKTEPFAQQLPFLTDVFNRAKAIANAPGPTLPSFSVTAPLQPDQIKAQSLLRANALGPAQSFVNNVVGANEYLLGPVLDPNNPVLTGAIQASIYPTFQALRESVLPGLEQQFLAEGTTGSSRQGIAQGQAVQGAAREALNSSRLLTNEYMSNALDAFTKGIALSPQTMDLTTAPVTQLEAVGAQNRDLVQSQLDEAAARHSFAQNLPALKLADYAALVSGNFGGTSTSTATGADIRQNRLLTALGGASTGAALGSSLSGAAWAGPAGAAIGLLAAFL